MSTREVAGVEVNFDGEGFMLNPDQWNREIAIALAEELGINPLTDRHWEVIEFCREDFKSQGESPTLRRITTQAGVPTKEIYKLFPKGPAKKVAYVSGLGKPTGCI